MKPCGSGRASSARASPTDPPQAAKPWRQVAPGRSVPDDQGNEALALAGCRPGWGRARRLGPEPGRQAGRQSSASKAAEAADAASACPDHGQAGELRRREGGGDAFGRASEAQRFKQQSGELAPADPTTRAADEAVQVTRPGS